MNASDLTIQQKIDLMTLATKTGLGIGQISTEIDTAISNYEKMVKAITAPATT